MSTSFKGFSLRPESVEWGKNFQKSCLLLRLLYFFKEFLVLIQVCVGKVTHKITNLQIYCHFKLDRRGCSLLLLIL